MIALCFFGIGIGLLFGVIFSIYYVRSDAEWKKILSLILSLGTGGGSFWGVYSAFGITNPDMVFTSIGCFCLAFLLAFFGCLLIMCKIMKDKNNNDVLRIRDIILGQKNYIDTYYKMRQQEIDDKLNYKSLKQREDELSQKEQIYEANLSVLKKDKEEYDKLTEDKLKIQLPEKKNVLITHEFLELFPSYADALGDFVHAINVETDNFISEHENINRKDFSAYLLLLSFHIAEHFFSKNSKEVRVHFRYYDEVKNGFAKLVCITAGKEYKQNLTFIPFDEANMIMKSFECKRALIKSHNVKYDYVSNNHTIWTDYMTGTFYNIKKDNKPCLSFGISVKNSSKFRALFNFLNYCKFETYLQEVIERVNLHCSIETILYEDHNM